MLGVQDVPGATAVTWDFATATFPVTGCPGLEARLSLPSRDEARPVTTTARFTVGEVTVTQTASFNISEFDHGEDIRDLNDLMLECDGQTFPARIQVLPHYVEGKETLTVLPRASLPAGTIGFRSQVVDDQGGTQTIERIYAAVTTEGRLPGMIVLTTRAPGTQPGNPAPLELLDKALNKAKAALDPTALNPPTPAPTPADVGRAFEELAQK
ncbi:hypothetical protein [Actinomyces bovis]|nr:hypothetical protein [Actinomyces bovis]